MTHAEALAKITRLKAEVERWMAMHAKLLEETAASTEEWTSLVERWRADREATEELVHKMGERLAAYEAGHAAGPRTH